jgi:hypothetical protein
MVSQPEGCHYITMRVKRVNGYSPSEDKTVPGPQTGYCIESNPLIVYRRSIPTADGKNDH